MKVQYIGETFGAVSLTDGKIYECLGYEADFDMLRIIDDSGEDYLYSLLNPRPLDGSSIGGKFIIVEDDENKSLKRLMDFWRE
ncbi:MAG: hypothetical protein RR552_07070 [Oscillospiraceae bacterium]